LNMAIDHIGVVVSRLEDGLRQRETLFGYSQLTDAVMNARQKVRVLFMAKEGSCTIKLIEPTEESSPVYRFANEGGGLHHFCFRCDNIDVEVERYRQMGFRMLSEMQPGEAFEGERIAFVLAGQGLNIELIESGNKARLRDQARKETNSST